MPCHLHTTFIELELSKEEGGRVEEVETEEIEVEGGSAKS